MADALPTGTRFRVYGEYPGGTPTVFSGCPFDSLDAAVRHASVCERGGATAVVTEERVVVRPKPERWDVRVVYDTAAEMRETVTLVGGQTLNEWMADRLGRAEVPVVSYSATLCRQGQG